MLLQAALNGPHGKAEHDAIPTAADELARDALACVRAGARAMHLHPRDAPGVERLAADVVDPVAAAVRAACGVPVGVSTGAWIEPDLERRVALVAAWREPDYASVNISEPGFERIAAALLAGGIGVEAGVWNVDDAQRLAASGLAPRLERVLVEPVAAGAGALAIVAEIHAALDAGGTTAPRLQHGDGDATWVLLQDAVARGIDTRIGFEDTLLLPDGSRAASNADLVAAARALGAR